jgi:hypothetical protein
VRGASSPISGLCLAFIGVLVSQQVQAGEFERWQQRYRPALPAIRGEVLEPRVQGLAPGIGARTVGDQIFISDHAALQLRPVLLRHELAHVYFSRACPGFAQVPGGVFMSEAFAQWASQDEKRIAGASGDLDSQVPYQSHAIAWAREFGLQKEPDAARLDANVARLLLSLRRSEDRVDDFFRGLFRECHGVGLTGGKSPVELPAFLKLAETPAESSQEGRSHFLFLHAATGVLRGDIEQAALRQPVASMMKPFLLGLSDHAPATVRPRMGVLWECLKLPAFQGIPRISWREALQGSCNGYFMGADAAVPWTPGLQARWFAFWQSLGAIQLAGAGSVAQAIGVQPGGSVSLQELLAGYIRLDEVQGPAGAGRDLLEALRDTPRIGTLAGVDGSGWFLSAGIGLKSGTVRDAVGRPEQGWIVAVGPRDLDGRLKWVAAIHQQGASPSLMLGEFQQRLRAVLTQTSSGEFEEARVQLAALVPEARIEMGCRDVGPMVYHARERSFIYHTPGHWLSSERQEAGDRVSCGAGPLLLRSSAFLRKGAEANIREYDGRWIEWGTLAPTGRSATGVLSPRTTGAAQRARRGSRLVLSTGLQSYIEAVLASEYAEGRGATLEALSRAVRLNVREGAARRHPGQNALCDSTHCQTFQGRWRGAALAGTEERISRAVRDSLDWQPQGGAARWAPFSAGGRGPWSRVVALDDINSALRLGVDPGAVVVELKKLRERSCDRLRGGLQLLSCPTEIRARDGAVEFKGRGAGHGLGLDLVRADEMAAEGRTAQEIWSAFFGRSRAANPEVDPYH